MRLFTVHPDHSIDPFIMGYLQPVNSDTYIANLFVHDLMGEERPIGQPIAPLHTTPIETPLEVPYQVQHALSHHQALIMFITQPMIDKPPNFHPALSLSAFCCGEVMCKYNQNQLASLWFMDNPGCIVSNGTHWSLTPENILLPTKLYQ